MQDDELDRLLARGRLTPGELDQTLDKVLASTAPKAQKQPWWSVSRLTGFSFATAAAALLIFFMVPREDPFAARGKASSLVLVEAICAEPCRVDSALAFRVQGLANIGYLAAFIQPEGGGQRIWLYPSASAPSPMIAPNAQPQLLKDGARLSMAPGKYEVRAFILKSPLGRDVITALADDDARVLAHLRTPLVVYP